MSRIKSMPQLRNDAPPPDLRIVLTESLFPHEEHDSQRAVPLIERLQTESVVINPPIVSPMGASQYVILDGANRYYAFSHLEYPHILVQVASYESGYVELKTWRHLVCDWDSNAFVQHLQELRDLELIEGQYTDAIAHILFRDNRVIGLRAPVENTHERNAVLRKIVAVYQQNAVLHRTALTEPDDIWPLHPNATAIVAFPQYQPADIMAAARYKAYLPPGISRHIIHGRALRVNYPLDSLRDVHVRLSEKNQNLQAWMQNKLENRRVRYYAEATYQFDE
jgi:L-serine kinase (ATP) / ParB family transcriptional regulator, heme-responsive regulator